MNLSSLSELNNILKNPGGIAGFFLKVSGFIFFTAWGWIILTILFVMAFLYNARNKQNRITFSGILGSFSDTAFRFYTGIAAIIISLVIAIIAGYIMNTLNTFDKTISLFREVTTLDAALKNMKAERKLIEVNVSPAMYSNEPAMDVKIKYFAHSPVRDLDVNTGDVSYKIPGKMLYVNFGVFNFDYSMIENGSAKNIAFPSRIYSDSVSYDNGIDISSANSGVPLTFRLEGADIFILDKQSYNDEIRVLGSSITNQEKARQLGLRTFYGEAAAVVPDLVRTYSFYSTAAGGIIIK